MPNIVLRLRSSVLALTFALLLAIVSPLGADRLFAEEAVSPESEVCTSCHSEEGDAWSVSPHHVADPNVAGQPGGASCVDCHGPYVKGHPDADTVKLSTTSEQCQDCHTDTYSQWEDSVHTRAGVECTGCHLVHSQTLRLSDETLCISCHRDDIGNNFHLSHRVNDVACTDCHPAPSDSPTVVKTESGETVVTIPAPNHDFVGISGDKCVECHGQLSDDERVALTLPAKDMTPVKLVEMAEQVPTLTAKVESVEAEKRSLALTSVVSLGLGMGIGGVMGMIVVLAVGFVMQRRSSK